MSERDDQSESGAEQGGVNPLYAAAQLAKALKAISDSNDEAARERAREKVRRWEVVLSSILSGSVEYGTRSPVKDAPPWATLEVVTGGFATGALVAGGALQEHERALLARLPPAVAGTERRVLNGHFLSDEGLKHLQDCLRSGQYAVNVPEEGALLVVAWLAERGYVNEARELCEQLSAQLAKLRFYPVPAQARRTSGSLVHLKTTGETLKDLKAVSPNKRILTQKEAVEIWAPLYDRMIGLFAETVVAGDPCGIYPSDWAHRASGLLTQYAELRSNHRLCSKPERARGHFAQVLQFLRRTAAEPHSLTRMEIGRLRTILQRYVAKRGSPGSAQCTSKRQRQLSDVKGPTHQQLAAIVAARLEKYLGTDALDDIEPLRLAIAAQEAAEHNVPEGTQIPASLVHKLERCLNEALDVLIERGHISSGETLARILPQITSTLRAQGFDDQALRELYAAIYRAFRRRRSLLLLNLESQIRIEELPWVAAIERHRKRSADDRAVARQALEEISTLTLAAFPHAVLPNKLLQELRALIKGAGLDVPLVDELAADIFMGQFSANFLRAAQIAAAMLDRSLYAIYFHIDYAALLAMRLPEPDEAKGGFFHRSSKSNEFAELCAARAGTKLGTWGKPAENGMIIEQQQILTTQNLAPLFARVGLGERLADQLLTMAKRCFEWICWRQQVRIDTHHARLIMLKNTAYAWRQMIFFLSLLDSQSAAEFASWAEGHLRKQSDVFRQRFDPALRGLAAAVQGQSPAAGGGRAFLGWSKERHWLLPEETRSSAKG